MNSSHVYAYNRAMPLLHAMTLCHFLWHHIFIYPLHHVPTLWFKIIVKPAENELWQWSQRLETWIIVCIIVHNQPCMSPIQNLLTFMVINWYSWASIRIQATDAVMASIAHCLAVETYDTSVCLTEPLTHNNIDIYCTTKTVNNRCLPIFL